VTSSKRGIQPHHPLRALELIDTSVPYTIKLQGNVAKPLLPWENLAIHVLLNPLLMPFRIQRLEFDGVLLYPWDC
jgi:hypothetical protein